MEIRKCSFLLIVGSIWIFMPILFHPEMVQSQPIGVMRGEVVNGTKGGPKVSGAEVFLYEIEGDQEKEKERTKTDQEGTFSFEGLRRGSDISYSVRVLYKEGEDLSRVIGVVLHQTFLYDHLTAYENLKFYGQMYDVETLRERIEELLDRVSLIDRICERVYTFSEGMKKRLSIARALLHNPSILLLDEPFAGLDQEGMKMVKEVLENHKKKGYTAIITSHDLESSLDMCNRVTILKKGVMVFNEDVHQIARDDFNHLYTHYVEIKEDPFRSGI